MNVDLEDDVANNLMLIEQMQSDWVSHMVWTALCTKMWFKLYDLSKAEDEQVVDVLSADLTDSKRMWSCSARYAGEMVADLRNLHHGCNEDYMDWAFRGYAIPADDIIAAFRAMGWIEVPYE